MSDSVSKRQDFPPSVLYTRKVLEYEGALTQPEIAVETDMPKRTVRYALGRLKEHGVVESEPIMGDARRKRYRLAESAG